MFLVYFFHFWVSHVSKRAKISSLTFEIDEEAVDVVLIKFVEDEEDVMIDELLEEELTSGGSR